MSDKALPNWVKVSKKGFNVIKNKIQQAKRNNLQARPQHGSPINFDESYKLIQEIVHGNITHEEALNKMAGIRKNIKRLAALNEFYPNQVKVINALFMEDEIFTGEFKRYKLSDVGYILLRSKSDKKELDIVKKNLISNQTLQTYLI